MRLRCLACAIVLAALPAFATPQSLAEVARKEKERRAKLDCASHVIDDKDLEAARGELANAESEASDGAAEDPEPLADRAPRLREDREAKRLEEYWRSEARRRRERVARLEREVAQSERWADPTYQGSDAPT